MGKNSNFTNGMYGLWNIYIFYTMKHLVIKNVGPIKNVDIELNRFNFVIGPQSSGKSTVAKILSACMWLEKEVVTTRNDKAISNGVEFRNLIESFHKMEGYFEDNSVIEFETENIAISYSNSELRVVRKKSEEYHREKICYIPAERNMVTLPELQGYEFGQTNLRSFLFDWFKAREFYGPENKTDVLDLGVKYFYDSKQLKQKDRIEHINGKTYSIALTSASSGLQSVVPLLVMLQYYSDEYFHSYEAWISFDMDEKSGKTYRSLLDECVLEKVKPGFTKEERNALIKRINEKLHNGNEEYKLLYDNFNNTFNRLTVPERSTFIIEEPEQNLYPDTQMDLLNLIVTLCQGKREHGFTVTTHSPYILNQLNLLFKRFDVDAKDGVRLNWDEVSVWTIEDGKMRDLKLRNAHLVNPEYLSAPLDKIYDLYEQYENPSGK